MDARQLTDRVTALHADAGHALPGVSVALLRRDEVLTAVAGVADVETGAEVTPGTLFHLASVSKVYNATLAMTLVDEGLLDLDVPVTTYLPGFTVSDPDTAARLTMRHLLTHTSGLDGDKFDAFGQGDDALARYVDSCRDIGQVHPLGATWSYCNSGVNIAGHVVATILGTSWDAALRTRVLDPIGATRSGTLPEDVVWYPVAVPHIESDGTVAPLRTWQNDRSSGPAGGVIATAADVLRFVRMHARKGEVDGGARVLSAQSAEAMLTPQISLPDGASDDTHAGIGWSLTHLDGGRIVGHGGDLVGTHARLTWLPDHDLALVVLGNGDTIDKVAEPLLAEVLAEAGLARPPKPARPDTPPDVDVTQRAGVFRTVAVQLELVPAGDHLDGTLEILDARIAEMMPPEQRRSRLTLYPVTDDRWVAKLPTSDEWVPAVFSTSDSRRYLHMGGRAMTAVG